MIVAELIGTATPDKNGLMSSVLASILNKRISNSGSNTNKLFHITNDNGFNNCLIIAVGRDNGNNLSNLIIAFNKKGYQVISKVGFSMNFFASKDVLKEYYISPLTSYGAITIIAINNDAIRFVDVTNTISTDNLERIM